MPGILYRTRVYLGGNLEFVDDEFGWREKVTNDISSIGIICLDPTKETLLGYELETKQDREVLKQKREQGDYDFVSKYMQNVISRDLRCIDISDFVIFKLELNKPTYGSIHELVIAEQQHKPIFLIINDRKQIPLWLSGIVKIKNVFETVDELILYLKKINSGEIEIDKKEWKLLNFCNR